MTVRSFDVIVIGSGPAGLSAARAAAEAGLAVVSIDRMGPGGQLMNLGTLHGVEGLKGCPPDATGPDLIAHIADGAMTAGVEIAIDEVEHAAHRDGRWHVAALAEQFEAPVLVIATGLTPGTTDVADEARFEGLGLSHCANCDAPLYAGKPVLVAGAGPWAVEEALELAPHVSRVTLVTPGALEATAERLAKLAETDVIQVVEGAVTALEGSEALERAIITETSGATRTIDAAGLFPLTGRVPASGLIDAAARSADGLFWAGDVRPGATETIAEAIADGARAGNNAAAWVKARR